MIAMALLMVIQVNISHPREAWRAPRHEVFGGGRHWVIVEVQTHQTQHINFPKPYVPREVSVSQDGNTVVFTAYNRTRHITTLYKLATDQAQPIEIGDTRGYHSDPQLSPDGRWVYFSHSQFGDGQPTAHSPNAYAQIYRVRSDGTGLELLTSGIGCHYGPAPAHGGVYYIHSSCKGTTKIEQLTGSSGHPKAFTTIDKNPQEVSVSPDGKWLLFSIEDLTTTTIEEASADLSHPRVLLTFKRGTPLSRARFGRSASEILY